jgi:zinc protease
VRGEISQEVFADADHREDLGLFAIVSIMASDHPPAEAEKIIRSELAALAAKPVPAAELEKAKNLIVTGGLRERETSNGKAFALGEAIVVAHDAGSANTRLARVQTITPAAVQRVVKQYLVDGKAVVITYVDQGEAK